MLKLSLHMSSLIHIPAKQQPVINRLHETMTQAVAYAAAIADNAIDDECIITSLVTAATVK